MASMWPPKKNTAFTLYFTLYKNDGTVIANPGTMTRAISIDGGAVDTTPDNAITEEDTTYGQISWVLSAAEMNGDAIWVYAKDDTSGCVPFTCTLYTSAQTLDDVEGLVDGVESTLGTPAGASLAADIADLPTAAENADALLGRNIGGGSSTGRLVKDALRFLRNKWSITGTTLTVYQEDDSTSAWTSTLATSGSAEGITESDPAGP